jgi:hypothetical protein
MEKDATLGKSLTLSRPLSKFKCLILLAVIFGICFAVPDGKSEEIRATDLRARRLHPHNPDDSSAVWYLLAKTWIAFIR